MKTLASVRNLALKYGNNGTWTIMVTATATIPHVIVRNIGELGRAVSELRAILKASHSVHQQHC